MSPAPVKLIGRESFGTLAAGLSGWLAASFAARDVLVVAGAVVALVVSVFFDVLANSNGSVAIATATAALLGLGAALVYPALNAAMSDAVLPVPRAPVVGVDRFRRDMPAWRAAVGGAPASVAATPPSEAVVR